MKNLAHTPENTAKILALRSIKETYWVGQTIHDTIDKCLTAINLFCWLNSGLYIPSAARFKAIKGIFMINEDGSLHFESRIIKLAEDKYRIEHLSDTGYQLFEQEYLKHLS